MKRRAHQRTITTGSQAATTCRVILMPAILMLMSVMGVVEALPRNNNNKNHPDSNFLNSLLASRSSGNSGGGGEARSSGSRGNHHRVGRGSSYYSRGSSVALDDSFPCESDGGSLPSSIGNNAAGAVVADTVGTLAADNGDVSTSPAVTVATSVPSPTANYLSTNSFMAQNNIIDAAKPSAPTNNQVNVNISASSLNIRGGGGAMGDDELDQMVDNLIAGLDEESESEVNEYDVETEAETESEDIDDEEDAISNNIEEESEEEEKVSEDDEEESVEPPSETSTKINSPLPIIKSSNTQSPSSTTRPLDRSLRSTQTKSLSIPAITPTNAYYRFLVRRGPKGHILASFTLLSVQYIHTYIPYLYQFIAAILLKLHIYNPRVLHEREYQRQMELKYGPRKKRGLTSKLFGTSSKKKSKSDEAKVALQQKNRMQKNADQDATTKLKQLYKTMKDGSGVGMLSEVKYRYLSGEFRRRHGLGKEYRVEKPRTFMGEVVEGSDGVGGSSNVMAGSDALLDDVDIVFSDGESEEDQEASRGTSLGHDAHVVESNGQRKGQQQTTRRVKRRPKMNDWVVKAFASSFYPRKESSTSASADTAGKAPSSLWKSVERDAILAAAWESRAAEQSATATPNRGRRGSATQLNDTSSNKINNNDGDSMIEAAVAASHTDGSIGNISSGGYGASKMFQSVMTRVGSGNGRIFGAYPNDAPSIGECAHERGVIGFARRYGYGDWRADNVMHSDDEDGDGDVLWGGGDLVFGGVDNAGLEVDLQPLSSRKRSTGGHKSRRKKKRSSSALNNKNDIGLAVAKTKRRKRSSKK